MYSDHYADYVQCSGQWLYQRSHGPSPSLGNGLLSTSAQCQAWVINQCSAVQSVMSLSSEMSYNKQSEMIAVFQAVKDIKPKRFLTDQSLHHL